jgi:hypothetical protein
LRRDDEQRLERPGQPVDGAVDEIELPLAHAHREPSETGVVLH